jgi:hypothetical protein
LSTHPGESQQVERVAGLQLSFTVWGWEMLVSNTKVAHSGCHPRNDQKNHMLCALESQLRVNQVLRLR